MDPSLLQQRMAFQKHAARTETRSMGKSESSSSHVDSSTPDGSQESLATARQGFLQNGFIGIKRVGGQKRRNTYQPPKEKVARMEEEQCAVNQKPSPTNSVPNGSQEPAAEQVREPAVRKTKKTPEKPELVKEEEQPTVETVLDIIKNELGLGMPFTVDQLQQKYRAKTGSPIYSDDYGFSSVKDLLIAQRQIVYLYLPEGHFFSFIKNEEEYEDVTGVVQEMMESGELPGPQLFQRTFGPEPGQVRSWPKCLPHLSMQQLNLVMIKDRISEMLPLTGVPMSLCEIRRAFFCRTHLNLSPENLLLLSWDQFFRELRRNPIPIIVKFEEDSGWTLQIVQKQWPAGRERFRDFVSRAITAKQDEGREVIHRLIEKYGGQTTLPELDRLYKEEYGIPLGREQRYLLTGVAGLNKFVRVLAQRAKMFAILRSSTGVWHIATYEYARGQQIDTFGLGSSVELDEDDSICEWPEEDEDRGITLQVGILKETPVDCGEDVTSTVGKAQIPERPAANDTEPPTVTGGALTKKTFIHVIKTSPSVEGASTSEVAQPPTVFVTDAVEQNPGSLFSAKRELSDTPTSSRDVNPPTSSLMAQTSLAPGVSKYAHFGHLFTSILDQADRNGEDVDARILRALNALYGR